MSEFIGRKSGFMAPDEVVQEGKEPGVIRVLISIPNAGYTQVESYANRLVNFMHLGKLEERGRILKENPRFEFIFNTQGRLYTALAREGAGDICLSTDSDYLFQIDDDMTGPDDLFERLYRHDVDIVAPLAFTRNYPHNAVLYRLEEGIDPETKMPYYLNRFIDSYPKDQLVECDAVGFGAVLIKAKVIKAMKKPRFMSACGTGEDVLFCHKARKLGFRIFMDTSTKLGHLSHPIEVTEDYVERVREQMKWEPVLNIHAEKKSIFEPSLMLGD
jgi:hypothetical protein